MWLAPCGLLLEGKDALLTWEGIAGAAHVFDSEPKDQGGTGSALTSGLP